MMRYFKYMSFLKKIFYDLDQLCKDREIFYCYKAESSHNANFVNADLL